MTAQTGGPILNILVYWIDQTNQRREVISNMFRCVVTTDLNLDNLSLWDLADLRVALHTAQRQFEEDLASLQEWSRETELTSAVERIKAIRQLMGCSLVRAKHLNDALK